ncbi:hypothetical protein HJC99_04280 [Candidatus Saccharibacteria bacterium]|nr:hypothetical protein [Candidatus Saccharibacteria bacterium]
MGQYSGTSGTHLSFSPEHDSPNGDNHVDGQRHVDGQENPWTQHVPQSDGYGNRSADIPVNRR